MFKTISDDVNGIGEKRKKKLLELYPTIESLQGVSKEELSQIIPEESAIEVLRKRDEYFLVPDKISKQ